MHLTEYACISRPTCTCTFTEYMCTHVDADNFFGGEARVVTLFGNGEHVASDVQLCDVRRTVDGDTWSPRFSFVDDQCVFNAHRSGETVFGNHMKDGREFTN